MFVSKNLSLTRAKSNSIQYQTTIKHNVNKKEKKLVAYTLSLLLELQDLQGLLTVCTNQDHNTAIGKHRHA